MRLVSDVLAQARKRLGIRENPPGSNRTSVGAEFGWNGQPWCAEFVCVCLLNAGFKLTKNASAHGLTSQLRSAGWKAVPVSQCAPGDIIDYTFSHTGLCEGRDGANVIAIEGNHNDAVMRVVRSQSSIARVTRPPYAKAVTVAPAPQSPSLTPGNPLYHKRAKMRRDSQLWNGTIGTKRNPSPKSGGIVTITGPNVTVHGVKYTSVSWGGNPGGGWVRYDDIKYI